MQAAVFELGKTSLSSGSQPNKSQKRVRFDSSTVDNEYKMRSRRGSIATRSSSRTMGFLTSQPSSRRGVANGSTTISLRSIEPPAVDYQTQVNRRHSAETEDPFHVERSPASQFQPRIPHLKSRRRTGSVDPRVVNTGNLTPSRRSANSAARRDALPRQQVPSYVPPRVPDPPFSPIRKPPPAPRPRRLSSPDLIDSDDGMFCACDANFHGAGCSLGGDQSTKMDAQLAAAEYHMKTGR